MTGRTVFRALLGATLALATSGCGTALALYELFKSDDDSTTTTTAADASADAATDEDAGDAAPVAVVEEPDAGPCTVGTRCGDGGVCGLDETCGARKPDGEECVASWECTGGYCVWNESAKSGLCDGTVNACKLRETGCTSDPHSCCEGARCHPAEFSSQPHCETCAVKDTPCDPANAAACCSGICSYGKCL